MEIEDIPTEETVRNILEKQVNDAISLINESAERMASFRVAVDDEEEDIDSKLVYQINEEEDHLDSDMGQFVLETWLQEKVAQLECGFECLSQLTPAIDQEWIKSRFCEMIEWFDDQDISKFGVSLVHGDYYLKNKWIKANERKLANWLKKSNSFQHACIYPIDPFYALSPSMSLFVELYGWSRDDLMNWISTMANDLEHYMDLKEVYKKAEEPLKPVMNAISSLVKEQEPVIDLSHLPRVPILDDFLEASNNRKDEKFSVLRDFKEIFMELQSDPRAHSPDTSLHMSEDVTGCDQIFEQDNDALMLWSEDDEQVPDISQDIVETDSIVWEFYQPESNSQRAKGSDVFI